MTQTSSRKKHADFQSNYRRSLNFNRLVDKDAFVLNEQGELVMRSSSQTPDSET
ncbi:MAG TPA: hypothetical protein PKW08_08600 [Flavobacteriaceae bacterium]|nr:hypothetical protein [Flavobacteriaceae bacterium]MCB9213175.1 hypothetical protein [Alteromonas sp.]HPF10153.1 hypothetical protein [Flavobacteriaceae bacterium]HQU21637.1 hypothetical protein [Flavobacteriaceae bacterium]HQU65790.1 hypothetical protein [Flavobacteriaceae bacterium]